MEEKGNDGLKTCSRKHKIKVFHGLNNFTEPQNSSFKTSSESEPSKNLHITYSRREKRQKPRVVDLI